jgi:hypothetical protein
MKSLVSKQTGAVARQLAITGKSNLECKDKVKIQIARLSFCSKSTIC